MPTHPATFSPNPRPCPACLGDGCTEYADGSIDRCWACRGSGVCVVDDDADETEDTTVCPGCGERMASTDDGECAECAAITAQEREAARAEDMCTARDERGIERSL